MDSDVLRLRIVIADDDVVLCNVLKHMVQRLGHEVVGVARDGCELIERVKQCAPDLVVTDVDMPRMNGIEAVDQFDRFVPCIVVSGCSVLLNTPTARAHWLTRLSKPFHLQALASAIDDARSMVLKT